MILTIDNKIHHLKELDFIERQLYGLFEPEKFYKELAKFIRDEKNIDLKNKTYLTFDEVKLVDNFVMNYFYGKIPEANTWFVRAYIVGEFLAESDKNLTIFSIESITKLPKTVLEAVKEYDLTQHEALILEEIIAKAGMNITNTTINTLQQVKQAMTEAVAQREGAAGVERRINEMIVDKDIGELNRDWKRVSIYESNAVFNDAYIDSLNEGDWVVGISMPDACDHCLEDINGKVYQVIKTPPPDYSNLEGEEYERVKKIWETKIWAGKNNIGRSSSPRKRIDKEKGNTKENLVDREHHELSMPCVPYHPNCRCRYVKFNPKLEWVDSKGNVRLAVEDPEEHENWYKENIAA